MKSRYIRAVDGGYVIRLVKIARKPDPDSGNLWNFVGHRWVASRQSFAKKVTGLSAYDWVPVELAYYTSTGPAVFIPDSRQETRNAVLNEFSE